MPIREEIKVFVTEVEPPFLIYVGVAALVMLGALVGTAPIAIALVGWSDWVAVLPTVLLYVVPGVAIVAAAMAWLLTRWMP